MRAVGLSSIAMVAAAFAPLALGCANAARAPATAPPLSHVDAPEVADGETPTLWREGTPGAVLLFVRNVMRRDVQDTAEDLANAFVERCDPELDAIAIVEPGVALAWPGIRQRAVEELARRQEWRARCLEKRGVPSELAQEDGKHQVQLVIDERNGVRHEVFGAADPGGDIVVAAFGARGEPVYRVPVPPGSGYSRVMGVVADAIRATGGSAKAPAAPQAFAPMRDQRVNLSIHESTSSCQRFECPGLSTQWFSSGK